LADVESIVTTIFDHITAALARGACVELRGWPARSRQKTNRSSDRAGRACPACHCSIGSIQIRLPPGMDKRQCLEDAISSPSCPGGNDATRKRYSPDVLPDHRGGC
jgi:hypothetical protein